MKQAIIRALFKKYESEIEDSHTKMDLMMKRPVIIPEHTDITGEIDKLLDNLLSASSILRREYVDNKAK